MPKSKRSKLVSLTKVDKKTREHKTAMMENVKENADKWKYCWLFEVGAMRNTHLKTVRNLWKDSARIFFSRSALLAKALGTTPEEEHRMGMHKLAKAILFTDTEPQEVIEWFADFSQPDYARAGNVASRTNHSLINEDPQLRKLGLTTTMNRGVPTLQSAHKLCEKGKVLTAEQAQLLKLIGERMVTFKVGLIARWDAATGDVTQIEGPRLQDGDSGAAKDDEAMSE
ncbi:mRNA turnover protein 4-like protein [Gymnopus androsaceus JB14]|uniref:Ribosome assembly factor mrt4 n=1 Tax=Gymnopus androsaceus JB14 TaxID=1447944 RepID=A0A6A4H572_9AGAR|nr:mRNA turnover protein 4-like protein [Gymnopus androsaceus JB14]